MGSIPRRKVIETSALRHRERARARASGRDEANHEGAAARDVARGDANLMCCDMRAWLNIDILLRARRVLARSAIEGVDRRRFEVR